jgi:hypothetical protein
MTTIPLETLRSADEDTVAKALKDNVDVPSLNSVPGADLLEFFNRMLDVLGAPDEDGDVYVIGEAAGL